MNAKFTRLAVLAGLLLAFSPPASGQIEISIKFGKSTAKLAKRLAQEVERVRWKYGDDRAALSTVPGPGGVPAYSRQAVLDLIDTTEKALDQAVERVADPRLAGLRNWAADAIEHRRGQLAPGGTPPTNPPAIPAVTRDSDARPVTVFAVFDGRPPRAEWARAAKKPRKVPPKPSPPPAPPQPDPLTATTVATGQADSVLDQVGKAIERLFFLADKNDLEVDLWVGSTPAPRATFRFWPKATASGTAPAPTILKTDARKTHVLRGLYAYRAAMPQGAVTEVIASDKPDGSASLGSERLDLVNGSSFFCCRFEESYCHHVDDEKECQPERH